MATHVEYHYHYHGPYNNYGQNTTGQGTINNISTPPSQSTDYPQSSEQPGVFLLFYLKSISGTQEFSRDNYPLS